MPKTKSTNNSCIEQRLQTKNNYQSQTSFLNLPMQEQARLISCLDGNGQKRQFVILLNVELGKGAFGTVNKAFEQGHQDRELAVKIIPYQNDKNKQTIKKEVDILRNLPQNRNLVGVLPLQCFSERNFYIFMEYCNEGTLSDQMKAKHNTKTPFTQEEIFKAFYQILNGYQALWKQRILHQDLKPQNVLIRDGTYKITDFGFSIFYQGVRLDKIRQGTCQYMPLQKLTVPNYFANTKSDVFSLGVIFFKMLTGRHPYLLRKIIDYKDYIMQVRMSQLNVPPYFRSKISIPMQQLFDIVVKMVAKEEKDRIDFDQIYSFIKEQQAFLKFIESEDKSQYVSIGTEIPHNPIIKFVEVSKAFVIPFSIPRDQEEEYEKLLKDQKIKFEEKEKYQAVLKVQRYICSMRIMVYFFDRLNRRLIVEKHKKLLNQNLIQEGDQIGEITQKAILALIYTSSKITTQTIEDARYGRIFTKDEWNIYRKTKPQILQLVKKDQEYLKCLTNQVIMETKQSRISDRHRIIQQARRPLLEFLTQEVRKRLIQLLETKTSWIPINDQKELVTLYFIISAIDIIDNFRERHEKWEELEGFFRQMESEDISSLRLKVTESLTRLKIEFSVDEGNWNEENEEEVAA